MDYQLAARIETGQKTQSIISSADIAPAFLKLAGLTPGKTFETKNLASSKEHQVTLLEMQGTLAVWPKKINDYLPTKRSPDEFHRVTGAPDHSVRKRPRPSKKAMFGTNVKY